MLMTVLKNYAAQRNAQTQWIYGCKLYAKTNNNSINLAKKTVSGPITDAASIRLGIILIIFQSLTDIFAKFSGQPGITKKMTALRRRHTLVLNRRHFEAGKCQIFEIEIICMEGKASRN